MEKGGKKGTPSPYCLRGYGEMKPPKVHWADGAANIVGEIPRVAQDAPQVAQDAHRAYEEFVAQLREVANVDRRP